MYGPCCIWELELLAPRDAAMAHWWNGIKNSTWNFQMRVRTCFEPSSGPSFYAWQRRLRNASDWRQSACDHVFSFLLSFARKSSSKKRLLGTRGCAHNARFDLWLTTWTNLVGTKTACLSHMKFCNGHLLQPEWVEQTFMQAKWGETLATVSANVLEFWKEMTPHFQSSKSVKQKQHDNLPSLLTPSKHTDYRENLQ